MFGGVWCVEKAGMALTTSFIHVALDMDRSPEANRTVVVEVENTLEL